MKITKAIIIIVCLLSLSACNTLGGQGEPVIDQYGDPNAGRINQDMSECQSLAGQASGGSSGTAGQTAIGAGTGALIGAAGGAIVGAFTGNPGLGAGIGAAAGGAGGALKQGYGSETSYKQAFANCMAGRGHRVIR